VPVSREREPTAKQPPDSPTGSAKGTQPKKIEALFTTLEDAKECFDKKSAVFVDARPEEDFKAGHIPGALSLDYSRIEELYDTVLGSMPKDRLIITYCSDPECQTAVKLADALVLRGHTRVVIMLEGFPAWEKAGYPVASG